MGLPSCSGAALGVDRLAMLLLGKETIEDVAIR
jgi:elongation factor P--beta-lysine ligase